VDDENEACDDDWHPEDGDPMMGTRCL